MPLLPHVCSVLSTWDLFSSPQSLQVNVNVLLHAKNDTYITWQPNASGVFDKEPNAFVSGSPSLTPTPSRKPS